MVTERPQPQQSLDVDTLILIGGAYPGKICPICIFLPITMKLASQIRKFVMIKYHQGLEDWEKKIGWKVPIFGVTCQKS